MGGINMNAKEFKVTIPEGMKIDKENSTFECIKFKPIEHKRWRDNEDAILNGYFITINGHISDKGVYNNTADNYNIFPTVKQAKSALAMARISQIMANDERFGGVITDEEWSDENMPKCVITRINKSICYEWYTNIYYFLAFHTVEQCDLFLEENEDLVKDYFCID